VGDFHDIAFMGAHIKDPLVVKDEVLAFDAL
jgi:hypothetical protein